MIEGKFYAVVNGQHLAEEFASIEAVWLAAIGWLRIKGDTVTVRDEHGSRVLDMVCRQTIQPGPRPTRCHHGSQPSQCTRCMAEAEPFILPGEPVEDEL